MALTICAECGGKVSDKAFACPACGNPIRQDQPRSPWAQTIGGIAGTYISVNGIVMILSGVAAFVAFAAIMIALIVSS